MTRRRGSRREHDSENQPNLFSSGRASPEFDERTRAIAVREGTMLVQIFEETLDAYEEKAAR